ncbi:MAG: FAD-binding protein [Proteobacteria bacterium]|nr:FAD-binding protein [Pseudomonadota bacterium]
MRPEEEFRNSAGDIKIISKAAEKDMYSHDIGDVPHIMTQTFFQTQPDFVVQPQSMDEIRRVLAFAHEKKMPVIPRGAASWGFGGVIPTQGGIVIDLSPFRKIISLDVKNKTVTVEAGARWSDIDILAKKDDLCLMSYPSSKFSTVAGWISTGGYGINSYRYGHISKQILSMTVVTPVGEVKKLTPADPEFSYFISTEGTCGIIVEVTLKLRDLPKNSYAHIFYFPTDKDAFDFVAQAARQKTAANVIRFVDANHMRETNEIMHANVFKEKAGVLVEFSNPGDEQNFLDLVKKFGNYEQSPDYAACYLWNERLFGMKAKRLGPTLLASEVILPIADSAAFIEKAKKLGSNYSVEMCIDAYILDKTQALIMTTFLCDSRKMKYFVHMPLVSMLTQTAVSMGAQPYGLGIWNAAFVNHLYSEDRQSEYKAYTAKVDPNGIMNPGKFLRIKSKFMNIPALAFHPLFFGLSMNLLILLSPVIGKIATMIFGKDKKIDALDLELCTHACAKCGNCIAVCPAYLVTRNEAVTGKGKVALAKKLIAGEPVTPEEAATAFMCMHCHACEEICQTNLDLMTLWDALERRLEANFGRPDDLIKEFLKTVDGSKDYWDMVERNS